MEQQWQHHNRSSHPWDDPVPGWQDGSRTDADVVYSSTVAMNKQFKHYWVVARKLAFSSGNLTTALLRTCWNRQSKLKSCTNSASSYFHRKKSAEVHSNEHSRRASHNFTHAIQTMHITTWTQGQGVITRLIVNYNHSHNYSKPHIFGFRVFFIFHLSLFWLYSFFLSIILYFSQKSKSHSE